MYLGGGRKDSIDIILVGEQQGLNCGYSIHFNLIQRGCSVAISAMKMATDYLQNTILKWLFVIF